MSPSPIVPIQMAPSFVCRSETTEPPGNVSLVEKFLKTPFLKLLNPPPFVPNQSVLSRATRRHETKLLLIALVLLLSYTSNLTPSNRAKPSCVPSQRYPSGVWTILETELCGKPLSSFHARCPYWVRTSS